MAERFPPANMVAAVLVWAAALVWGRALSTSGPLAFGARDAAGALAAVGFFLMLRVFDEHKDYAADCVTHPNRVLQRGVVTLQHLKVVGAVAVGVQLGASLLIDGGMGPTTRTWLLALVWSLLMAREFFAGDWLRSRLVLYAVLHMAVMPLAVLWMVRMGSADAGLPAVAWWLPAASYLTGFSFEIARKLKAPGDERSGVDSYTRAFGTRRAPLVLAVVLTIAVAAFLMMVRLAAGGWVALAGAGVLVAALLGALAALLRFRSQPDTRAARASETRVGLAVAVSHLVLVITVLVARGIAVV